MIRRILLGVVALVVAALGLPPLWYSISPAPKPDLPPAGRRVEVAPAVGANVIEVGQGPPIVLVHGHPGCAYDWAPLMAALSARGYRVLAYDRIGYGRSDGRADGDYTVDANADDLLALLAAENLHDAVVIGHSYGGGTAIVAARKDPSRMADIVLVGSIGPGIEKHDGPPPAVIDLLAGPVLSWLRYVPPAAHSVRASLSATAFDPAPTSPGFLGQLDANFAQPHTLDTFRSEGRDLDGTADLDPGMIHLPILIIQGDGDKLVPPAVANELHQRARGSDLWMIQGGGHMLLITHTEELAKRIDGFIRGARMREEGTGMREQG